MASKTTAPQAVGGQSNNSRACNPATKELDASIRMHFNTQPSQGGLAKIENEAPTNPEVGTGPKRPTATAALGD